MFFEVLAEHNVGHSVVTSCLKFIVFIPPICPMYNYTSATSFGRSLSIHALIFVPQAQLFETVKDRRVSTEVLFK